MEELLIKGFLAFILSLALSLIGTRVMLFVSRKVGWIDQVKEDRWHKEPTAKMGGIAIYIAIVTTILIFFWPITNIHVVGLLVGGTIIFVLGLVDDLRYVSPLVKILIQIVAAVVVIVSGVSSEYFYPLIGIPLTIFWIIAITNAYNLIDNMDGLSSGIAAVSSFCIFLFSMIMGWTDTALLSAVMFGAALGFLRYNFNPAKIFMGDSGALFIGFYFSVITLIGTMTHMSNLIITIIVPLLVMVVPIFDTTFVTISRTVSRRPVYRGGRDHTSHRMVTLGLSERGTVLFIYVFSLVFGLFGVMYAIPGANFILVSSLLVVSLVFLFLLGAFLGGAKSGATENGYDEVKRERGLLTLLFETRGRIAVIFSDALIVVASYLLAYLVMGMGSIGNEEARIITESLPLIVFFQMISFYSFGVYRGLWQYITFRDMVRVVGGSVSGVIASSVVLFLFKISMEYSVWVMIVYFLILNFLISARMASLRGFKEYFTHYKVKKADKRILIFGAGDAGNTLLKEILNNDNLNFRPCGFIDDDPKKTGKHINGLEVLGTRERLEAVIKENGVEEVIVAVPSLSDEAFDDVREICQGLDISFKRMSAII